MNKTIRNIEFSDYTDIKEIMDIVYANAGGAWTENQVLSQIKQFPEGQICICDDNKLIAAIISIIVYFNNEDHTYNQITSNGFLYNHTYKGNVLYGVDMFIHPKYQNQHLGKELYHIRRKIRKDFNLERIVIGGRIPNFINYSIPVKDYVSKVINKKIFDPVLSFQLSNSFNIIKILPNYFPEDMESRTYGILMETI